MARQFNLQIDAGSTFEVDMPAVRDQTGTVKNLTGFTARATMKKSYDSSNGVDFDAEVTDAENGIITLLLEASKTSLLEPVRYVYDLIIGDAADTITKVLEGTVDVIASVTAIRTRERKEPTSRQAFIDYCKRKLGWPVIQLNLEDDQIEDAVDDALLFFREYHYDATHRTYLKHVVTQEDITNMWIPCNEDIITVVKAILDDSDNISLFDFRYQLKLQDFYNFSNVSMQNYVIVEQKMALLDFILNVQPEIRFNRHMNRIYLNVDWKHDIYVGKRLIFEVYQAINGDAYSHIWKDRWLKEYGVTLIKQVWGSTMKKHGNVVLIGGTTLSGQQVYDEATSEKALLRKEVIESLQAPPRLMLG